MKNIDYAQSVILARVYEKHLLDDAKIQRMIDAKDEHEAFKILLDSEYAKSSNNVFDVYGYTELINQEMARVGNLAQELLNDDRLFEIMTLKYDYHNLKIIIKSLYCSRDLSEKFYISKRYNPKLMLAQVEAGKYSNLRKEFSYAIKEAIAEYEKTKDPQRIDIVIDRFYFSHLLKLTNEVDLEYFCKYTMAEIDFYNIISLFRMIKMKKGSIFAKKVFIDGGHISPSKLVEFINADSDKIISAIKGWDCSKYLIRGIEEYKKTGSLFKLEQEKKNYFNELNKDSRFITFGPEPIIAYILAKEEEIQKVRFIIIAKLNKISEDIIRERLGMYV